MKKRAETRKVYSEADIKELYKKARDILDERQTVVTEYLHDLVDSAIIKNNVGILGADVLAKEREEDRK